MNLRIIVHIAVAMGLLYLILKEFDKENGRALNAVQITVQLMERKKCPTVHTVSFHIILLK
jgi:hypothetical protein